MSQAGTRRDRSKSSDDDSGVPSPENSAQSLKSATSPLSKIVFIQKVALFAGTTPKKALQLVYVTPEWRETVVDFTFDVLFFDPFIKPILQEIPSTTSSTEEEKEVQRQNQKKNLELFQQFRKVVSFVFKHVSDENKELRDRMKTLLAVLFDFVHNRRNDNNNRKINGFFHWQVHSFLRADSLRSFLRIDDLHDLIINHIAPRVTDIDQFGCLIYHIVQDERSAVLYSDVESYSAILKCFHRSRTSADAFWIASSINNILTYNPSSNKLFNSLPVVEAFSFIIPLADDDETVQWISNAEAVQQISTALEKILSNNEEAQKKFETAEFLKIFRGMEKHETKMTNEAKKSFKSVIEVLKPHKTCCQLI